MQESHGIKSLETAGLLLETLSTMDGPVDLKVLVQRAGISPSVAHAYLTSFSRLGLVKQDPGSRQYSLGSFALELGLSELRSLDPLGHVLCAAARLRDDLQQVAAVSVWGTGGPTVIRVYRTDQIFYSTLYEGAVLPLETTATGRIFSAYMPQHMVVTALRESRRRQGSGDDSGQQDLGAIVSTVRENGLAFIEGLPIPGVVSMSVPIFDHSGALVCALTMSGRQGNPLFVRGGQVWSALHETAVALSLRFGWREDLTQGEV